MSTQELINAAMVAKTEDELDGIVAQLCGRIHGNEWLRFLNSLPQPWLED